MNDMDDSAENGRLTHRALCYEVLDEWTVGCTLCPRRCALKSGQRGFCGVRCGAKDHVITLSYGRLSAVHLDPVEKKPFYHFKPGTNVLSVGGVGCTLHCSFCQNHHLLNTEQATVYVSPEALVQAALDSENCSSIAFTYNEGSLHLEYLLDTAVIAHGVGLKIILVTNGYISLEALRYLEGAVDAMNIDLKGFTEQYYQELCGGHLEPVLDCIEMAAKITHVELTYLAVHPLNILEEDFKRCVQWIKGVNDQIPLHISRYFPCYRLSLPETPLSVLYELQGCAKQYLQHVYIGNVAGSNRQIFCPKCLIPWELPGVERAVIGETLTCANCCTVLYGVL